MSVLSNGRRFGPATRLVWRHKAASFEVLVSEVREFALRGDVVRIYRYCGPAPFEVVFNTPLFLVRVADGPAIGSYENVAWALLAGDEHVDPDNERGRR